MYLRLLCDCMGFGKEGKGAIITQSDIITLATLANNVALKQDAPLAITEDFRIISLEATMALVGATAGENPISVYLVNDELSVTEIAEAIAANGPLGRSDRLRQEHAERAVFLLGTFVGGGTNVHIHGAMAQNTIVKKTIRWTFSSAQGWSIVAFNHSGAALTTGAVIRMLVKFYGVWLM